MRPMALRRARLAAFMGQAAVPAAASARLAITALRAYALREPVSQRGYTLVKIETAGGISGFGETRSATPAELESARSIVRGRQATEFEALRPRLAAIPNLQAAVNIALLDIVGQSAKAPVYQLLGGPTRHKARAMARLEGATEEAAMASLKRAQAAGYRAFLAAVIPGASPNSGQAFVLANRKRLEAMRAAAGEQSDFVLDCGGALTPGDAATLSAALERFHPLWIDEPCALVNLTAIAKIANERVTPLGFGRTLHHGGAFQDLLRADAIDVFRPDIALNGISQIRRFAALAESNYMAVAPYHDGGPVGTAAALHLAASLPNFFIQQIPLPEAEADRRFRAELAGSALETVTDGYAALPVGPGLGIQVNASMLGKEVA
jgi:galactonate dehydratase